MAAPPPNITEIIATKGPGYLDEYCGYKLVHVGAAMIVVNSLFVGLRFLARYINRTPWWWDDWLMFPALIFVISLPAQGFGEYPHMP